VADATGDGGFPRWKLTLALVVLSPFLAEWMTGSTPPSEILNPIAFLVSAAGLAGLYGGGVLIIRELSLRWSKGWASILLLGTAYGILEEGVAVHTFFSPGGSPVGVLGSYGHWLGTNWVWAVGLSGFHGAVSIALPILLVSLWWPAARQLRLLEGRRFLWTALAYTSTVLIFAFIAPHAPSWGGYVGCLVAVAGLIALARWVPTDLLLAPVGRGPPRPWVLAALGFVFLPGWLLVSGIGAATHLPPVVTIALVLLLCELPILLGYRYIGRLDRPQAALAFATGTVLSLAGFSLILGIAQPVAGTLVTLPISGFLLYRLSQRIKRWETPTLGLPPPGSFGRDLPADSMTRSKSATPE
jgi:hypothetical protein